jgi:hypothetical protein
MSSRAYTWHVVTPEYPPQIGGVADYSRAVADELQHQGATVRVWHPGAGPLLDGYSPRGLRALSAAIDQGERPRRLFVQWVPHGYGYKAMNVPFCVWLLSRAAAGDHIDLMIHEPFLMFREGSIKQDIAAAVHRLMMTMALRASSRLWVTIPSWEPRVRPWLWGRSVPVEWLPVPSNIPVDPAPPNSLADFFPAFPSTPTPVVVGHFGTYGKAITLLLKQIIPPLLARPNVFVLLLGRDSDQVAASFSHPRVVGTGAQPASPLSRGIAACDLFLQPFSDGVSTRRSSAMAALIHGKPLLTTTGLPTETLWAERQAAVLVPAAEPQQLIPEALRFIDDPSLRLEYGARARAVYLDLFDLPRTVRRLRESLPGGA